MIQSNTYGYEKITKEQKEKLDNELLEFIGKLKGIRVEDFVKFEQIGVKRAEDIEARELASIDSKYWRDFRRGYGPGNSNEWWWRWREPKKTKGWFQMLEENIKALTKKIKSQAIVFYDWVTLNPSELILILFSIFFIIVYVTVLVKYTDYYPWVIQPESYYVPIVLVYKSTKESYRKLREYIRKSIKSSMRGRRLRYKTRIQRSWFRLFKIMRRYPGPKPKKYEDIMMGIRLRRSPWIKGRGLYHKNGLLYTGPFRRKRKKNWLFRKFRRKYRRVVHFNFRYKYRYFDRAWNQPYGIYRTGMRNRIEESILRNIYQTIPRKRRKQTICINWENYLTRNTPAERWAIKKELYRFVRVCYHPVDGNRLIIRFINKMVRKYNLYDNERVFYSYMYKYYPRGAKEAKQINTKPIKKGFVKRKY